MAQTYKIRSGLRACATIWLPRHLSCGSSSQMAAKIKKSLPSCRWPLAVAFLRKCHGTSTWHQKVSSEMLETCKRPVLFQSTLLKERSRLEFWSLVYKKCTVPYPVSKSRPVYWKLQTVDKAIKPDKQEINKNPLCPERFWFLARTEPGDLWHSQRQKNPSPESPPSVNPNGDLSVWLVVDIVCWEAVSRIALKAKNFWELSLLTTPLANDTCLKPTPVVLRCNSNSGNIWK